MKKKDLEISQMWTLSIGHISKADRDLLEDHVKKSYSNVPLAVFDTKYGYYVKMLRDDHDSTPFGTQLMEAGFSDDFAEIFCIAIRHKIEVVNLDCDGPIIKDLPVYDW